MLRLSPSTLKQFRKDLAGRRPEDTPGCPYWTSRLSMALNHIETLEEDIKKLRQPSLFAPETKNGGHP